MWNPPSNKVWTFGIYCEQRRLDPSRVLKLVHDPQLYDLSDIKPSNGTTRDDSTTIHTISVPSRNSYDALQSSDTSTTDGSGGDLQARKHRQPVASFHIKSNGIDHDMCHVALQQEGEQEEDVDKEDKRDEEDPATKPMMTDKPTEMRPYSVALEVMFKKKELKSKRRRMCLIALAVLLAVLLVGGIAAVLIIFVGNIGDSQPEPVAIQGEFRISNINYSDAYSNPESTEYKQLQQDFINEMDNLYMNSTYKNLYIGTDVSGFREGSVIVAFVVNLKRMSSENTGTSKGDDDDNEVDNDTNQPDDDENQTNPVYREATDFILISVNQGTLGNFQGRVITLTLAPGRGKPVERVTIPTTTRTATTTTLPPATTKTTTTRISSTTAPVSSTTTTTTTTAAAPSTTTLPPRSSTRSTTTTLKATTLGPSSTDIVTAANPLGEEDGSDSESHSISFSSVYEDHTFCDENHCLHGATCVYFLGASFCQCPDGYSGALCEREGLPDPCEPSPCVNGGNCTSFINSALCTCPDDYYGQYCETASMSVPSSSYDYMYESITPFPDAFPLPGGSVLDCEPIVIEECLDVLPFNRTTLPNPHGLGNTMEDIVAQYNMLSVHINSECHPEGTRVICSLLHTKCTGETTNLFMAFLQTYTPCRSLCLEIGSSCSTPLDIDSLCNSLPESADPTICYRSPDATGPPSCTPDYCLNNGSCFVIMDQTFCRCTRGFIGEKCELEAIDPCISDPCLNGATCQTETPSLPGVPMLYICLCQSGYYGQHCEQEHQDELANLGIADKTDHTECGSELLIPECANIVPYNTSYSSPVLGRRYASKDWPSILNQANQCHEEAAIFICARMQRKCTFEGPLLPCRSLCDRVAASCDIASFGLPDRGCSTYSDSLNHLDCFDTKY